MNNELTLTQFLNWLTTDSLVSQETIDQLCAAAEKRLDVIAQRVQDSGGTLGTSIEERICEQIFYTLGDDDSIPESFGTHQVNDIG